MQFLGAFAIGVGVGVIACTIACFIAYIRVCKKEKKLINEKVSDIKDVFEED